MKTKTEIVMSTTLEYRARGTKEKKREREAQAGDAQRDKGRQRSRGTDKKQRRHFLLEEQHENFVTAVTK